MGERHFLYVWVQSAPMHNAVVLTQVKRVQFVFLLKSGSLKDGSRVV